MISGFNYLTSLNLDSNTSRLLANSAKSFEVVLISLIMITCSSVVELVLELPSAVLEANALIFSRSFATSFVSTRNLFEISSTKLLIFWN